MPGSTAILDSFTRANASTLGANWALLTNFNFGGSDLGVISNQAYNPTGGTYIVMYWSAATFGPDCECYLTLSTVSSDNIALYARTQQPGYNTFDGYMLNVDRTAGEFSIRRVDNGTETVLGAAASQTVANGNKILLECVGSTITAYIDTGSGWVSVLSRTDTTYGSAGGLAFYGGGNATTWRYDDFGGGTLSSGSAYTDTGSAAGVGSASGADVLSFAEAGSAASAGSSTGADILSSTEAGASVGAARGSAADAVSFVDTGSATSAASASVADSFSGTYTETGGASTGASATGADAMGVIDAATAVAALFGSSADGLTLTDSGAATSVASASGVESTLWIDTGGALGIAVGRGADTLLMIDTGTGVLVTKGSGSTGVPARGSLAIEWSARAPGITYAPSAPALSFGSRRPEIEDAT